MRGPYSPGGGRSGTQARRMYVVRRVLALLLVLLVLALIIPRACQAITGSEEDTAGSGKDRGAKAPEKAAGGAGAQEDDEAATAEDATDENATDGKGGAGEDEAREEKDTGKQEGEKDLGAVLTETLADRGTEPTGTEQGAAADTGAAQPAPVALQAPAEGGGGSSGTAAPVEKPPLEPAPEPSAGSKPAPVASGPPSPRRGPKPAPRPIEPPAVRQVSISKPTFGLAQAQAPAPSPAPVGAAPVQATPVAATPVQPAVNNTAFAGGGAAPSAPMTNAAAFSGPARGSFVTGRDFAGIRGSF